MTKEEIIDIVRFRTWLKLSKEIGNNYSREDWQTLDLINALLSSDKYPETFYIRDILDFLEKNENQDLLYHMQIFCCNGWPIPENRMMHANHMFVHRLLVPFNNYDRTYGISLLRTAPLRRYTNNTKSGIGLDLHAFYNDSFIGTEYHSMNIFKYFVKNVDIDYSSPLELPLTPKEKSDEYLDLILFEHIRLRTFLKYDTYSGRDENREVNYNRIEQESIEVLKRYVQRLERKKIKIDREGFNQNIREYIYSKWNFRFKIEDDGDIFLYDYNYIADEEFYKNIFHKMIGKKSYRMKSYKKDFNLKMNVLEFETFVKGHREYVNHDPETIKILIY